MAELRVRIQAILRRVVLDRMPGAPTVQELPPAESGLLFDDEGSDVRREGVRQLDPQRVPSARYLQRNADEVLSKAFLYQQVLQRGYAAHDRSPHAYQPDPAKAQNYRLLPA